MHSFYGACEYMGVLFGVKMLTNGKNHLYVIVANEGIKKATVMEPRAAEESVALGSRVASEVNIARLASKVNTPDILKYLPHDFLSTEQVEIKNKAIADTIAYTNNKNDKSGALQDAFRGVLRL